MNAVAEMPQPWVALVTNQRQQLIIEHYPMARAIACKIYARLPKMVDVDDLISSAVTGLIEAIDRYDSERSVPFVVYARHRIHGAVMDSLRAQDWVPRSVRRKSESIKSKRKQLTEELGRDPTRSEMARAFDITDGKFDRMDRESVVKPMFSLDAPVAADNPTPLVEQISSTEDFLGAWEDCELRSLTIDALHNLPERERVAVMLYYLHELALKEVGTVLGVTESRACQLCAQGVRRLRYRLRRHAV